MTNTPIVKIALPTKSITSNEPRDFALHSSYSTIRIFAEDEDDVTISAGGSTTVTINHDLGFVPISMLFTELSPGHFYQGVCIPNQADGFPTAYLYVSPNSAETYVDEDDLIFKVYNTFGTEKTISYHYYIFADDGV